MRGRISCSNTIAFSLAYVGGISSASSGDEGVAAAGTPLLAASLSARMPALRIAHCSSVSSSG
eukprot:12925698-Prorocentrum_lima.AAC.1